MPFFKSIDRYGEEMENGGVWTNTTTDPLATGNTGILPRWVNNTANGTKWFVDANGIAKQLSSNNQVVTTSLAPKTGNGTAYVNPTLVSETTLVDEIQLSDGSYIRSGKVTFTGHGLPIHTYFYASATAPYYTSTVPTTGWSQQLFYTQDANTIDVLIQEGVNLDIINGGGSNPTFAKTVYVNATSPTTATIFDLNNPPTTNDNTLKADANNIYIGKDGSTWTYNSSTSTYSTYVYPITVKHGVLAYAPAGQSVANGVVHTVTGFNTSINTSGFAWNATTGEFTAQRAGWYSVTWNVFFQAGNWNGGSQEQAIITKNNAYIASNYYFSQVAVTGYYVNSVQTTVDVYLNVGDVIKAQAYQGSGTAKLLSGGIYNTFSISEK